MPTAIRNTVDRLDRPSAYYLGKVRPPITQPAPPNPSSPKPANQKPPQNKKRKHDRDRDEERERTPEPPEDPLKDATTLYVGNLYVHALGTPIRVPQSTKTGI